MSLCYKGKLSKVAENFKLDIRKNTFPYKFPNKDNLNYIGDVPSVEYWNSENDRNEYIK